MSVRQTSFEGAMLEGRYQILEAIGSGGMGTVYEAIDTQTHEVVAVKALKRKLTPENLARFSREAEAASAVRHPNLCHVHSMGVSYGIPYLVMERITGETLRARIARDGMFTIADTISIGVQLLDALSAAHAARVLHRDVKPGNVLITTKRGQTPQIKLIDFGLARILPSDAGDVTLITVAGVIPGTPAYLSPEQVVGSRDLDEGVDIWGAALTLFELLTARHGFTAESFEALAHRITLSPCPSVRESRRDIPLEVEAVIAKALAKRRSDRWASAAAFRTALIEAWARHRVDALQRGSRLVAGVSTQRLFERSKSRRSKTQRIT